MNVAIVVAGGKGLRFGGNRPKQFLEINAIPIIVHTLRQFERSNQIETVMVVLPPEETAAFQSLPDKFGLKKVAQIAAGGETRAQSVQKGLAAIAEADVIAVHDGVRPLVTPELFATTTKPLAKKSISKMPRWMPIKSRPGPFAAADPSSSTTLPKAASSA